MSRMSTANHYFGCLAKIDRQPHLCATKGLLSQVRRRVSTTAKPLAYVSVFAICERMSLEQRVRARGKSKVSHKRCAETAVRARSRCSHPNFVGLVYMIGLLELNMTEADSPLRSLKHERLRKSAKLGW